MVFVPSDFAQTGQFFLRRTEAVSRFQVIGERSSGTNFLSQVLNKNTPLVPSNVLGWKHGQLQMAMIPSDLVVAVSVRGADAWARSMFAKPWHTTQAMQSLGFSEFLRARWETVIDRRRYFRDCASELEIGRPLQFDRDPTTGDCYDNLFALRRGKLQAHLTFLNRDCNICLVRSETVVADPEGFLHRFLAAFGLPPMNKAFNPVLRRLGSRFAPSIESNRVPPEHLSQGDLAFLREQSDLALESRLGYDY